MRPLALAAMAMMLMLSVAMTAQAAPMTLTDIAGRQVTLKAMPKKIVLGEGRMMYAISAIIDGNPFEKLVGWKDDLILYDPDAFRKFRAVFPSDAERMINFGSPYAGDFSIEAVLEANADLVLLDVGNLFKAEESGVNRQAGKGRCPGGLHRFSP